MNLLTLAVVWILTIIALVWSHHQIMRDTTTDPDPCETCDIDNPSCDRCVGA